MLCFEFLVLRKYWKYHSYKYGHWKSFSIVEKMWKANYLNHASKRNSLEHKKVLYYNFELQLGWCVGQYWTVLIFYSKNRNYCGCYTPLCLILKFCFIKLIHKYRSLIINYMIIFNWFAWNENFSSVFSDHGEVSARFTVMKVLHIIVIVFLNRCCLTCKGRSYHS